MPAKGAAKLPSSPAKRSSRRRPLPYLECVQKRRGVEVWLVEGSWVRTNRDEDFSNFGHHWSYPKLIPKAEIWIDQESAPDEHRFYQSHAFLERRLMADGQDYETAHRKANDHERKLRITAGDLHKVRDGKDLPQPTKCHSRLWKALGNGVKVWYVKGRLVRSVFNLDFTEGGHEHVYEFVPHNEIWIDDDLQQDEVAYVLFHELHERALMAGGMEYDSAHAEASRKEVHLRKHPAELHQALVDEGWE